MVEGEPEGVDMAMDKPVIHSDPEILGGTPVFVGTRVPLRNLIDYLEGDYALEEFLDDFPTVTREQAIAALDARGPGWRYAAANTSFAKVAAVIAEGQPA